MSSNRKRKRLAAQQALGQSAAGDAAGAGAGAGSAAPPAHSADPRAWMAGSASQPAPDFISFAQLTDADFVKTPVRNGKARVGAGGDRSDSSDQPPRKQQRVSKDQQASNPPKTNKEKRQAKKLVKQQAAAQLAAQSATQSAASSAAGSSKKGKNKKKSGQKAAHSASKPAPEVLTGGSLPPAQSPPSSLHHAPTQALSAAAASASAAGAPASAAAVSGPPAASGAGAGAAGTPAARSAKRESGKRLSGSAASRQKLSASDTVVKRQLSTFPFESKRIETSADRDSYTLSMMEGESICFHGAVALRVLSGTVRVYGHVLLPESGRVELHSPLWNALALLSIEALQLDDDQHSDNKSAGFAAVVVLSASGTNLKQDERRDVERADTYLFGQQNAVQIPGFHPIIEARDRVLEADMGTSAAGAGAGSASASPDIVSMDLSSDAGSALFGENDDTPAAGAAAATASAALAVESVAAINISPAWLDASLTLLSVDDQPRPPAILMCGARNSGKSTLGRFVLNSLLNRYATVAFLETDVGQCEFTPPGLVSLHYVSQPVFGPPHSHMRHPDCAFFVGDTTSNSDPLLYVEHVKSAVQRYRSGPSCPLLINTPGWVTGLGLHFLREIVAVIRPSHIVELGSFATTPADSAAERKAEQKRQATRSALFPEGSLQFEPAPQFLLLPQYSGGSMKASRASPVTLRNLAFMSYFAGSTKETVSLGSIARLLAAQRPWRVPWSALQLRVLHVDLQPEDYLASLNGAVVGLCVIDEQTAAGSGAGAGAGAGAAASAAGAGEGAAATGTAGSGFGSGPGSGSAQPPSSAAVELKAESAEWLGLRVPASVPPCTCVGLGIVRSIDVAARALYLLTPVPAASLARVSLLLRGRLDLPPVFLYQGASASLGASPHLEPYLTSAVLTTPGAGASAQRSRNNLVRKRLQNA